MDVVRKQPRSRWSIGEALLKLLDTEPPADLGDMDLGIIHPALKAAFAHRKRASSAAAQSPYRRGQVGVPADENVRSQTRGTDTVYGDETRMVIDAARIRQVWPTYGHHLKALKASTPTSSAEHAAYRGFTVLETVLSSRWVAWLLRHQMAPRRQAVLPDAGHHDAAAAGDHDPGS